MRAADRPAEHPGDACKTPENGSKMAVGWTFRPGSAYAGACCITAARQLQHTIWNGRLTCAIFTPWSGYMTLMHHWIFTATSWVWLKPDAWIMKLAGLRWFSSPLQRTRALLNKRISQFLMLRAFLLSLAVKSTVLTTIHDCVVKNRSNSPSADSSPILLDA